MTNDLIPTEDPTSQSSWLSQFNLPQVLLGPAGKAISRLVGELVDIPSAKIAQYRQAIQDKTEAKQVMSRAVAQAAAQQAVADPALVQRAANSFLSKELRAQSNKEAIAEKTLIELKAAEAPKADDDPSQPGEIEDDWLNVFERYAEEASSERLQTKWAQVLAGQIRRPKSFSLRTLRFIAELDEETASLFEKVSPTIVNADFVPNPPKQGSEFSELLSLQDAGLLTGASGSLHKTFEFEGQILPFRYKSHAVVIFPTGKIDLRIPTALLTQVGREIYEITRAPDDISHARAFVEKMRKDNMRQIMYASTTQAHVSAVELWSKVAEKGD